MPQAGIGTVTVTVSPPSKRHLKRNTELYTAYKCRAGNVVVLADAETRNALPPPRPTLTTLPAVPTFPPAPDPLGGGAPDGLPWLAPPALSF